MQHTRYKIYMNQGSSEAASQLVLQLAKKLDLSKLSYNSRRLAHERDKLPNVVRNSSLTSKGNNNKTLKPLRREIKDTKSMPKLRPQEVNSFPLLNELNDVATIPPNPQYSSIKEETKNVCDRRSTSVIKLMNKMGTTHDVSYIHDFGNKPLRVEPKIEFEPRQPSEIKCKLPEVKSERRLDNQTIEELKEIGRKLNPKEDFESIFNKEADSRVHLLLKQDIFKNLAFEFLDEAQQKFFAKMLTSHRRENLLKEDKGLGVPSSRSDSVVLTKWLNAVMSKISTMLDKEFRIDLARTVYYICFREVVRQISVHCIERGFLVWQLWTAYSELIVKLGERYKMKQRKIVQLNDTKVASMRSLYESELAVAKDKSQQLQAELDRYKNEVDEVKKQLKVCKVKNEELRKEIRIDNGKLADLSDKYEKLNTLYCEELYSHNSLRADFETVKASLARLQAGAAKRFKSAYTATLSSNRDSGTPEDMEGADNARSVQTEAGKLIFSEPILINIERRAKLGIQTFRPMTIRMAESMYKGGYNFKSSAPLHNAKATIEFTEISQKEEQKLDIDEPDREHCRDQANKRKHIKILNRAHNKLTKTMPESAAINEDERGKSIDRDDPISTYEKVNMSTEVKSKINIVPESNEDHSIRKHRKVYESYNQLSSEAMTPVKQKSSRIRNFKLSNRQRSSDNNETELRKLNSHLNKQLKVERRNMERAREKMKSLEEESYILKDKLETINDNLKQIENCNDLLQQLLDELKLEEPGKSIDKIKEIIKEMQEYYRKIRAELNSAKAYETLEPFSQRIKDFSNRATFPFKVKEHSFSHLKNYTRGFKELDEWIQRNISKSTRKCLVKYENGVGFILLAKVLASGAEVCPMPRKFLLKLITDTYNHVLPLKDWNSDLPNHLFSFLIHCYGLQCIAEKKFSKIVAGCLAHSSCKRIQMFARFLGLLEGYTQDDFKQYLHMVKAITST